MKTIGILASLLMVAALSTGCSVTASGGDPAKPGPSDTDSIPDVDSPTAQTLAIGEKEATSANYVVMLDPSVFKELNRKYTFHGQAKTDLTFGWDLYQQQECTKAHSSFALVKYGEDGTVDSNALITMFDKYTVKAGQAYDVIVTVSDFASCKKLKIGFAINKR